MSDLGYVDIRPILARLSDLDRDLVLVGGQAVNFWAFVYEGRVPALARGRAVRKPGRRLLREPADRSPVCATARRPRARLDLGRRNPQQRHRRFRRFQGCAALARHPLGALRARRPEVRDTAIAVNILDDAGKPTGVRFHVIHPVLSLESRVHNVAGLADVYDTGRGRTQLRASIVCAHEFMKDVLDGGFEFHNPQRTVLKLNERIVRFCMHDRDARELHRRRPEIDPAAGSSMIGGYRRHFARSGLCRCGTCWRRGAET